MDQIEQCKIRMMSTYSNSQTTSRTTHGSVQKLQPQQGPHMVLLPSPTQIKPTTLTAKAENRESREPL